MTVEKFELTGQASSLVGRVYHSDKTDPTMGMYVTMVEVVGDQVRVGTPLISHWSLSNVEVQSVVQLLTGREARVGTQPTDEIVNVEGSCPRCWKTYDFT